MLEKETIQNLLTQGRRSKVQKAKTLATWATKEIRKLKNTSWWVEHRPEFDPHTQKHILLGSDWLQFLVWLEDLFTRLVEPILTALISEVFPVLPCPVLVGLTVSLSYRC